MPHTPPPDLKAALHAERHALKRAQIPVITVSATFKKELIAKYQTLTRPTSEAIFSRAHYSMAQAVVEQAQKSHLTAHLVDPTNFVASDSWNKIEFTEHVGQMMARHQTLKWIKDKIDTIARSKLPITEAITPPLIYLTESVKKPIISLHYEAGNIVAAYGKPIIQVLTDPHVRPQYLSPLLPLSAASSVSKPQITFAVFDADTKKELIKLALILEKQLDSKDIVITGPPVDPRITKLAKLPRRITKNQPINIGITTGGLGTNLHEIKVVLDQFAPLLSAQSNCIRLFLYAGSHQDFRTLFESFASQNNLKIGNLDDANSPLRILYEDSIVDANDNLIRYLFPWAHLVITKPSGDMAYDAAAAGCGLLLLEPWGEWEENIQKRFIKLGVASNLNVKKAHKHFSYLLTTGLLQKSLTKAKLLPPLYRSGTKNIINLHTKKSKKLESTT